MCNPILLQTERLILRMFAPDDIKDLHRQLSDPDVMEYYPKVSMREDSEKWLQGILKDYETNGFGMLGVCSKETGEFVGQAGVMRRMPDGCETNYLSYLICKEFWGHGYATEAARGILDYGFGELGMRKVTALVRTDNTRSIRVLEKLGMHCESTTDHCGREHYVYTLTP